MNRNIEPSITEISRPSLWGHQQITLPNGIEIVYLHDPNQEVFKMDVVLSAGIYNQSRPVIASSMINMLNEGTRQHTSAKLQSCLIIMEHTWISIAVCTKLN